MENKNITEKLIDIKQQVSKLGFEYLKTQEPFRLDETEQILKPFIMIDSAIDQALKRFDRNVIPGSIPKQSQLKS